MRPQNSTTVAIVGGGILGMSLTMRLGKRFAVTILEEAAVTGGLRRTRSHRQIHLGPLLHVILLSDRPLQRLLDDLGLSDRLHWGIARTGSSATDDCTRCRTMLKFSRSVPFHCSTMPPWP